MRPVGDLWLQVVGWWFVLSQSMQRYWLASLGVACLFWFWALWLCYSWPADPLVWVGAGLLAMLGGWPFMHVVRTLRKTV